MIPDTAVALNLTTRMQHRLVDLQRLVHLPQLPLTAPVRRL